MTVWLYIHIEHIEFSFLECAESFGDTGFSIPDGFDLGTKQLQPSGPAVFKEVLVLCFLILSYDAALLVHGCKESAIVSTESYIEEHHYNESSNKSQSSYISVFISLSFWDHFLNHYVYHGTCGEC